MAKLKDGNEKKPPLATLVPIHHVPEGSVAHLISDGENWNTLAARYGWQAREIIQLNFKTASPQEINWYLREYVNCDQPTADGYNWRFSTSARNGPSPRAGKIFVLPRWALILDAARKATRDSVLDWFRSAIASGDVEGPVLRVLPGMVRSVFTTKYHFIQRLRVGGAPDVMAERWAGFLESALSKFTKGIRLEEQNAFPIYRQWHPGIVPPPVPSIPVRLLQDSREDFCVKRFFVRTQLARDCQITDPAGVQMVNAYATWFEQSFAQFRQGAVARGFLGIVTPMPSPGGLVVLRGEAHAAPGTMQVSPMPL
jgi:hypothetical protein